VILAQHVAETGDGVVLELVGLLVLAQDCKVSPRRLAVPAERIFDFAGGLQMVAAVLPVTLAGLVVFAGVYAFTAGAQVSRRRKRASLHCTPCCTSQWSSRSSTCCCR
jgi:hypothetical protein